MKILEPDTAYTFSEIFELQIPTDEPAAEFGYSFSRKKLNLPQYSDELDRLDELRSLRRSFTLCWLDRSNQQIEQGLESYRVPEDIEPWMGILIDALTRRPQGTSLPGHW